MFGKLLDESKMISKHSRALSGARGIFFIDVKVLEILIFNNFHFWRFCIGCVSISLYFQCYIHIYIYIYIYFQIWIHVLHPS